MHSDLGPRFGTFLIIAGIGLLMVFVTYELGGTGQFDQFLISLLLIFLGIRLKSLKNSGSPDARFKSLRGISEKYKQKDSQKSSTKNKTQDNKPNYYE